MRDFEDPVHGPWWYLSPQRFLRRVLVIALGVGAMMFAGTEWLKHELANAPTRYPDGRLVYPDGRVEHPDG